MKKVFFFLLLIILLAGCNDDQKPQLKISVNSWIGYTPIFYAYDKGWLEAYNIKILNPVSLAESMYLYNASNADALTGTQYEFKQLKKNHPDLAPLMLFNRSNGGDMILSNQSIAQLKQTQKVIDVYLEIDSVNSELIKDFISYHHFNKHQLRYINKDQAIIARMKNISAETPVIIVTYVPYNIPLEKQGLKIIASTREKDVLTVIDALYATQGTNNQHREQFKYLKKQVDRATEVLKKNPEEFYQHVKYYIQDITYQEFITALHDIEWINDKSPVEIKKELQHIDIPLNGLL